MVNSFLMSLINGHLNWNARTYVYACIGDNTFLQVTNVNQVLSKLALHTLRIAIR